MQGIGIDIVDNKRIKKALNDAFLSIVLSKEEKDISASYSEKRLVEFVAGRFAAKEAIIKCLSGIEKPVMSQLNIVNDSLGKPSIQYKSYDIMISISHEREYSCAIALLK